MSAKLYAVVDDDDAEIVGIYSTLTLAAQAMERVPFSRVEERELDKLPDEPEGHREPDYGAPSAAERLERDSFDADREGREYDKYQHQEDLEAIRREDEAEAQRMRQLEERQEVRDENRRLGQ